MSGSAFINSMTVLLKFIRLAVVAGMSMLLLLISYTVLGLFFHGIPYRTMRGPLPGGAHLSRMHPFSERIVLRAPDGEVVVRDVAHVLFNDDYIAGEFYDTPHSTERFVYKVGDDRAHRDLAGDDDPFEAMLDASGLEAEWPWGPEDPNWLDYKRLLVRLGLRSPFPE
jgi:hypothetical protein